jgi:hypothetical protein
VAALAARVGGAVAAHPITTEPGNFRTDAESYRALLERLNSNTAMVTPSSPAGCPRPF